MAFPVEAVLSQDQTGAATDNLKKQWAGLIRYVPELESCAQGTINVDLKHPILVLNPHRTVPPFEWQPGQVEGFGILEIKFEWPFDTEPFQAWVYLAHQSHHRYNLLRAEVITKEIPSLRGKTQFTSEERRCRLHYPDFCGGIV